MATDQGRPLVEAVPSEFLLAGEVVEMGKGRDIARTLDLETGGTGIHADVLDDFKDQLMIVLLNRLARNGKVSIPVSEVDGTGSYMVAFSINSGVFNFEVTKKS